MNYKVFMSLEKFGGEEGKWKEWFFNFKIAFNSHGQRYKTVLMSIIKDKPSGTGEETIARWRGQADDEGFLDCFDKVGGELFGKLCLLTSGGGNMLVRGTPEENGWYAFKRLVERFDGKNPTSMIRRLTDVIAPGNIKTVREVYLGIEGWEQKLKDWELGFGETVSNWRCL